MKKKWLLVCLTILVVLTALVYLLIPANVRISKKTGILVTQAAIFRNVIENNDWTKWWPGKAVDISNPQAVRYSYNNREYLISSKTINTIHFTIDGKTKSILTLYPAKLDSMVFVWDAVAPTSYNPVKRISAYFEAKEIERDIAGVLEKMQEFFSSTENVYGVDIKYSHVVDSFLVSTFEKTSEYPKLDIAYKLIDKLKSFIAAKGAKETGYPMLNISTVDNETWITRVAIPVDKRLESSGDISYKWMLGGGNIIIGEVKGGPATVNRALEQLTNYVNDYQRIPPAIPFQSLVTDRMKETDTTRWITKIYYPIM